MAKRPVPQYDFKAFGAAIKAARTGRKESRKEVFDKLLFFQAILFFPILLGFFIRKRSA